MNKFKILSLFILLIISISGIYAQKGDHTIVGTVLDPYNKKPIEGAVVGVTGQKSSVKTDKDGKFIIQTSTAKGELTVWFPGYLTEVQPLDGRSEISLVLVPENKYNSAQDILLPIVGPSNIRTKYSNLQAVQKKDISIANTEVEQIFTKLAGVNVIGKGGMSGEGSYFNVRGLNTFSANTVPLIVVNGIPYMPDVNESGVIGGHSKSILNSFNPRDIQNITVLKGAEASVYGSLGSNGVILIETDKAIDLDTKVEFSSQFGVEMNQSKLPVMGVKDFKSYIGNVALTEYTDMARVLQLFPFLVDDESYYYKFMYNNNTNWQNQIYAPGFSTDNLLKIKGGDAIAKYDISIGFKNKGGQVKGTDFSKYYARLNSDVNMSRKLTFNSSLMMSYMTYNLQEQGMLKATNPILAALKKGPLFSPYKKDADNNLLPDFEPIHSDNSYLLDTERYGNLIVNNMVSNPLALVKTLDANQQDYDIQINAGLKYKVNDYLSVSGAMGLYYFFSRQNIFVPGVTNQSIMPLSDLAAANTVRSAQGTTFNTYFNLNANYNRVFDYVHEIKLSAGSQIAVNSNVYDAGSGYNTSNDFYKTLGNTSNKSRVFYGYTDMWNWMNFNFSGQYVYNQQVAIGAKMTLDASSSTGADAQLFQLYPAVYTTFMLKNSLLKNVEAVNKMNLRAEFASTGNSRFSSSLSKYYYINKLFYKLSGLVREGIPNTQIVPEKSNTFNVGTDISLLNNRLDFTADLYITKSSDLIMPVSVVASYGTDMIYDNAANADTKGFEVGAQFTAVNLKNFKWYIGGTIATNKSKITSLGRQSSMVMTLADGASAISKLGESLYSFYGLQVDKTNPVFATTNDAATATTSGYLKTAAGESYNAGDIHYVDQNNDGIIDDRDRVIIGNANPDFFGTLYTHLQYKNFSLTANFGYSAGNDMYNAVRRSMESMSDYTNQLVSVNRRWVSEGQVTDIPKATYGDPMGNAQFSDRWIEDASYIKLKELTLSYDLKVMNGLTVYVTGENLFTITKYLGLDPETMYSNDAALRGFDYAKVPLARSFKLGFNIKL